MLYLPRNLRAHQLYGMSPVEQIALTVNIALRRDASTLDYYRAGSSPDAFATLPKEWTADQIRSFQDYFDALMSGNLARRRQTKFMPADFKLIEARQPPLKDQYDEWLARIICYAFSVPVSPFVTQVNRATGETMRQQATQEGLVPLKRWLKNALDHVIHVCMNEPGLEFVWVGDDAVDPLEQAQTLQILVGAGIKTREEARADLGLAPVGGKGPAAEVAGPLVAKRDASRSLLGKLNRIMTNKDDLRRRTERSPPWAARRASRGPPAFRSRAMTRRLGRMWADGMSPRSNPSSLPERPAPRKAHRPRPPGTVAEAILRDGALPGAPEPGTWARTMPASDNPTATAKDYAIGLYNGQSPKSEKSLGDGGFIAELPDGSFITFRPAGQASDKTEPTTATVDINDPKIKQLNGGRALKLKFPRKWAVMRIPKDIALWLQENSPRIRRMAVGTSELCARRDRFCPSGLRGSVAIWGGHDLSKS